MNNTFRTDKFAFSYSESHVESHVLWESHCHAQYEMVAVLEGDISIMLEGANYRLTEDQAIILPPLSYHTVTVNHRSFYRRITTLFDLHAVPPVLQADFVQRDTELTLFSSPQIHDLRRICQEAEAAYYEPLAESLMTQILYNRVHAPIVNPEEIKTDEFLLEIVAFIDRHLCDKILLDDLARHTARSKSSVCHLFEEKMGIPPKQYILQKKMAYANKLIREGTPPTLAAVQVGYENYSAFYRIYQKHLKSSPAKDRP